MPRDRKPVPKSILENDQTVLFTPYLTGSGLPVSDSELSFNRGNELSMRGDKVKDISIGLQDIDEAVMYYFNNVIKPTVIQDDNRMAVRVIYGNPERWKSVQQDGFYRDSNNQITVPIIMIKRGEVSKNRTAGNKLDGNIVHNYQVVGTKYNHRNAYDKFSILNNRQASQQYYVTAVPDYVDITYNCIIFTNFVEQNNKIVEAIEYASDSHWGDVNRFKFKARIDSFSTTTIIENGADRAAKTTFNIKLGGYIIPDTVNKDLAATRSKFYTKSQIVFDMEVIDASSDVTSIESLMFANSTPAQNSIGSTAFIGGGINVTNTISPTLNVNDLAYLNTNKTVVANTVTNTTATFNSTSILQPSTGSSLPATSLANFSFYANSLPITTDEIVSFVSDGGGNMVLTINPTLLGYYLTGKTIIAVGKFQ
jgi:hypothetical protein